MPKTKSQELAFAWMMSLAMAYAASRYTEAKLSGICTELFRDIDKDTIDFADNYDGSMLPMMPR